MRRLVLLAALLALAAPAVAEAKPTVSIQVSATRGAAPLQVTLVASGDAASYHWELGDGSIADGASVTHVFDRGGAYHVVVTATGGDGETAQEAVDIAALAVSLRAPRVVTYGRRTRFRGRILPAARGVTVALRQGEAGSTATASRIARLLPGVAAASNAKARSRQISLSTARQR